MKLLAVSMIAILLGAASASPRASPAVVGSSRVRKALPRRGVGSQSKERLVARPKSGMERFLVKVALGMEPSIFVPTERPPAHRLYIITNGAALYRGKKCFVGDSWGAEDVLLISRPDKKCYKAAALTWGRALVEPPRSRPLVRTLCALAVL